MQRDLRELCRLAKQNLACHGLNVYGLHYFVPQTGPRKKEAIFVCLDATTDNPNFFGKDGYDNWRRIKLVDFAYEVGYGFLAERFPEHQLLLDIQVHLVQPYCPTEPAFEGCKLAAGAVDVTSDKDVSLPLIGPLRKQGEIEAGSTLDTYCLRYGLRRVVQHGRHFVSPDSASVEAFEAICETRDIKSVLEIGGGVGPCGVAAQKRGIGDFTFVDVSEKVCNYLGINFSYRVIHSDIFRLDLRRHWDVVLVGIPYELQPRLIEEKGTEIHSCCDTVVFQSGSMAFFDFEHNRIAGKPGSRAWPWWSKDQTLPFLFHDRVFEANFDWQTCLVAGKDRQELRRISSKMTERGFSEIEYETISL